MLELVCASNRSRVMHTTDGNRKDECTKEALPEDTDPFLLEVEEQHQGNNTISNGNDACGNDESSRIDELVVGCTQIAAVVHTDNGEASQESSQDIEEASHENAVHSHFCNVECEAETNDRKYT